MRLSIEEAPSPNFDERRLGPIDILLLHYTAMPSCAGAIAWLRDPRSSVSCHYVVSEEGRIARLVDEDKRAWHAGVGFWAGATDVNSRSIGIELCHPGDPAVPYPEAQIAALIALCQGILSRHPIQPERVLGHSDTAPLRKRDPGEWFPWEGLAASGIGHYVEPAPITGGAVLARGARGKAVADLQRNLSAYGYGLDVTGQYDETTEAVVIAFQRHFRPARVDGVADRSTRATLLRLLAALRPSA